MIITHEITLDVNYDKIETINIKQYTKDSHTLHVRLTENGIDFPIDPETTICRFKMLTPNNNYIFINAVINSDGTITVNIPESACLAAGNGKAELQFENPETASILLSMSFDVNIVKSVFNHVDIIPYDDFDALNQALIKAEKDYKYVMESAQASADAAKDSETNAATSETNAATSETNAAISETNAQNAAENASNSETKAFQYSNNANDSALISQSYAVGGTQKRENEDNDNAKHYYNQAKNYSNQAKNYYETLQQFGNVTGVKGNAESSYRKGAVNLTAANIGAVSKTGDTMTGTLFINGSGITQYAPNTTGGHAQGIHWNRYNQSTVSAGLGAFGQADAISSIYAAVGTTEPWNGANGLCITSSDMKWKNSKVVTENSGKASSATNANYATSAGSANSATTATKATQDGNGNNIVDTYLPKAGGTITGNLTLKGSGNYGNQINFGDGDYVHISEPTDDHLEIKGTYINFVASGGLTLNDKKILTIDQIYPVGSIYMSVNSTSPATLFGGTWVRWGNGRVPVGVDTSQTEFNTVEKTGGGKTHTLSTAEMPSHSHTTTAQTAATTSSGSHQHRLKYIRAVADTGYLARVSTDGDDWLGSSVTESAGAHAHSVTIPALTTNTNGSGNAHNNLQPYITCYMWKRTA